MTTMEPASNIPSTTANPPAARNTAPIKKEVTVSTPFRIGANTKKIIAVLTILVVMYTTLRLGLSALPYINTYFQREHMRVNGITFSPDTGLIRMENQSPPAISLTIDNQDFVRTLPETLGRLSMLRSLTIIGQTMTELPQSIGSLTNLESLTIYNTPIRTLPDSIGNLSSLTELTIVGGNLSSLPSNIANLTNLKTINLAYNHIRAFPTGVGALPNLISIDLTGNPIRSLPAGFSPSVTSVFLGNTGVSRTTIRALETPSLFIYY